MERIEDKGRVEWERLEVIFSSGFKRFSQYGAWGLSFMNILKLGVLKNPSTMGFFNGTFKVTPKFPAEILGSRLLQGGFLSLEQGSRDLFNSLKFLPREV